MKNKNKSVDTNRNNEFLTIKEKFKYTEKQIEILKTGLNKDTRCLILDGAAGTSKTFLGVLIALKLLNQRKIRNISYIRSLIQSQDGETGFIPGDINEKTESFNVPLIDKLQEFLIKPEITKLFKEEIIKTFPTSMLRGNQLEGCVIVDECQNLLFSSIETALTRMGEHSLIILCGDASGSQNDLGVKTGFKKACQLFSDKESQDNGIFYFKLDPSDIVRSKFVKFIVEKIQKYNSLDKK